MESVAFLALAMLSIAVSNVLAVPKMRPNHARRDAVRAGSSWRSHYAIQVHPIHLQTEETPDRGLLENRLLLDHDLEAAGGRCGGHGTAIVATVVLRD